MLKMKELRKFTLDLKFVHYISYSNII